MYTRINLPRTQKVVNLIVDQPFTCPLDFATIKTGRAYLAQLEEQLVTFFDASYAVSSLLDYRTYYVDCMMRELYKQFGLNAVSDLALLAVGGYGRSELFLKSDIDILVASKDALSDEAQEKVSQFISYLWDLKLDIGSSVRTIVETLENVNADLTICTNLLETRFICGNQNTYNLLLTTIHNDSTWNTKRFFHAKVAEELERHHAYKDTAYSLEPDLKQNPGGIRDIHVMQWIANFHFQAKTPEDMLSLEFLSPEEYEELIESRDVLYQVRYALHVCNRKEDNRLTLDYQPSVATRLGYHGDNNICVENMMRDLYRTLRRIRELNSMALQLEVLRITGHLGDEETQFLSNDFLRRGPLIDVTSEEVFENDKSKMLEIFLLMSKHPEVVGLHVNCLRLLRRTRRSLSNYLVEIPECRAIFKSILENPNAACVALPLMHEHRILSAYMPSWEKIEGLSQFDMFHTFTVDEHTVRVIKNIELISRSTESVHTLFRHVYNQISNPEILIVAALMHDIAKGQGGHHAQLGAGEALYFCQLHKYTLYQTRLVSWLVLNHLLMSATAQRRDINDPQVVNEFSKQVQDEEHLDLLYCLTAADIAATNDHEWTSWKDSIFRKLYFAVRQALRQGLERPQDLALHVKENQQLALKLCRRVSEEQARRWWAQLPETYFIQYTPLDIAWHTRNILQHQRSSEPLILFAQHQELGTELFIYQKTGRFEFARAACVMAQKRLNVITAEIVQTADNSALCTIRFHGPTGQAVDNDRLHNLRRSMLDGLKREPSLTGLKLTAFKSPFTIPPQVEFLDSGTERHTSIEISTLDTPGLLAKIGITLKNLGCYILSARVTTTGERADDFFTLVSAAGTALNAAQQLEVKGALLQALAAQADAAAAPRR